MSGHRVGNGAAVTVSMPARLHLGFLDLDGGLGRRFGSLGIALQAPRTRVRLERGTPAASGPDADRAARYLALVVDRLKMDPRLRLCVDEAIPAHVGLGSGTQLALAVGAAACRLAEVPFAPRELAGLLDRGARSGLGIAFAEAGGVVLDGGRGPGEGPPPVISRLPFPAAWRILLVLDEARRGLSGAEEARALERLLPFAAERAAYLCRLMLMRGLPALAEHDLGGFSTAVAELQRTVGDHFAPAQGGRYTSPGVAEVLAWLEGEGVAGVGQSSWGPTGFGLIGSAEEAERLVAGARARWPAASGLAFRVTRGGERGAEVTTVP